MTTRVLELYGESTARPIFAWAQIMADERCPYLARKCIKVRKSQPDISIGTCTVAYGPEQEPIVICPHRMLERRQIFSDCLHLLSRHEPGNELHVVSEVSVPGGDVDFFLVSAHDRKVRDFVGIEIQTLDSTGTIWPERQRFLRSVGMNVEDRDAESEKSYGMNWKMNAKTILVQLHHKVGTFEHLNRHLVLVVQDRFLRYMKGEFSLSHFTEPAIAGHSMHLHAYAVRRMGQVLTIQLASRLSTDEEGIAAALGLQADTNVTLESLNKVLEQKISDATVFGPA